MTRALAITTWVTAEDVMRAVGCSRSTAYAYLAEARGDAERQSGLSRVSLERWEAFARRKFGEGAVQEAEAPKARRRAPVKAPARPGLRLVVSNGTPLQVQPTQPRTRRRAEG